MEDKPEVLEAVLKETVDLVMDLLTVCCEVYMCYVVCLFVHGFVC